MNTALGKTVVKNWYDETIKLRTRKEKGSKSKMLVKGKELPLELNQGLMKWYSTRPTTARPKLVIFNVQEIPPKAEAASRNTRRHGLYVIQGRDIP